MMLFIIISDTVTCAPFKMPCGIRNMFATECSNPSATNVVMGQKMAKIFPATEVVAMVPHTARHTSQLHSTPLKNATLNGKDALVVAIPITAAFSAGAAAVAAPNARYAMTTLPMKFPAYDNAQFRINASVLIRFVNTPLSMVMTFPVNSSAPVRITRVKPAGKPTAPFKKLHKPGFAEASAGDAVPTQLIKRAPRPTSAPAENPRTNVVAGSCAAFFSAAVHTVLKTAGGGSASPPGVAFATTLRSLRALDAVVVATRLANAPTKAEVRAEEARRTEARTRAVCVTGATATADMVAMLNDTKRDLI